jgi:lipooligosaccharide transport system permease protein
MASLSTAVPLADQGRGQHGARAPLTPWERTVAVLGYYVTQYRRTWRGTIIGRFLSPIFFLLSMGLGLGALVDDRAGGVDGMPYLEYVVPAIVATQAMWVAMGESTWPVLGHIKWDRGFHAMLATPLGVKDVLAGSFLALTLHLTIATGIFMVIAALFGGFGSWLAVLSLPIAVLTGLAFAVPIYAFTAKQEGDSGFNILFRWVMTPLMLFSGTFFPIEQLPAWMQPVAWLTPLWHGVDASRQASAGAIEPGSFAGHLIVLLIFIVLGWVLAVRSFERRLVR